MHLTSELKKVSDTKLPRNEKNPGSVPTTWTPKKDTAIVMDSCLLLLNHTFALILVEACTSPLNGTWDIVMPCSVSRLFRDVATINRSVAGKGEEGEEGRERRKGEGIILPNCKLLKGTDCMVNIAPTCPDS